MATPSGPLTFASDEDRLNYIQYTAENAAGGALSTIADLTILGNNTGGTHLPVALNASQGRTVLGLGTAALLSAAALLQSANNLSDIGSASSARTNLGLGTAAVLASSAVALTANNLSDLANASTARTNLGLAALAVLSSVDLSGSQATGTLAAARFPALTGDITTSAGAVATTLATVNSNVGSFGASNSVGTFTVNAKGLITAAATASIGGLDTTAISSGTLAAGRMPALTGDVTTTVGTVATVLATVNSNTGAWGDATHVGQVTLDGKGRATAATSVAIALGATGDATGTLPGALTIAAGAVTLAKQANLAANSIVGNNTGSSATPLALTASQVKTLLAISASDVSGLAAIPLLVK